MPELRALGIYFTFDEQGRLEEIERLRKKWELSDAEMMLVYTKILVGPSDRSRRAD
jgi:hypothetical protein